ncbi:hypothetical protein D3C73_1491390 [compost metagenome]
MKFRLGDTVRVIQRRSGYFDKVGRVTQIDKTGRGLPFAVSGLHDRGPVCYGAHELILAEKEDSK